jgi:hypothetical protein
MKRFPLISLAILFSSVWVMAADATGTWTGSITPEGRGTEPLQFVIKQEGAMLTGTAGPHSQEQHPIQNGLVKDEKITFEVPNGNRTFRFDLTFSGTEMNGKAQLLSGGEIRGNATVSMQRQK